jgi:hypothetical protein
LDGVGLRFQVEFGAAFGDFGVEGFDAEVKAFGLAAACAVVFGGRKTGEGGEGLSVGRRSSPEMNLVLFIWLLVVVACSGLAWQRFVQVSVANLHEALPSKISFHCFQVPECTSCGVAIPKAVCGRR